MKVFLVLASVAMLASAAPQYPNSVGGYSGGRGAGSSLDIAQLLAAVTRQSSAARSSYGAPAPAPSTQYGVGNGAGNGNGGGSNNGNGGNGNGNGLGGGNGNGLGGGAGGLDNGLGGGDGGLGGAGQEQQVHKHVYVHVAPSEAPEPKAAKAPSAPQIPEKHYKILFIRAPEPAPYEQPDIADLPPAPEQKTLVYVLLKKPDATPAITLPTAAPTKPSKPEVYFIRYKSPENNGPNGNNGDNGAYGAPNAGGAPIGGSAPSSSGSDASSQYGAPSRSGY